MKVRARATKDGRAKARKGSFSELSQWARRKLRRGWRVALRKIKRRPAFVIISRKDWEARAPRSRTQMSRSDGVHIHHTTGKTLGHDDLAAWVRNIQNFHMDTRGWSDIGYCHLIGWDADDAQARIFEGRGWGAVGAHTLGYNSTSHGVALLGDGTTLPPREVRKAFRWLISQHDKFWGEGYVKGHRDRAPTACPGDALYSWLGRL